MKGKPTRANRRDEHTLAGAYAMDAISAKERDRFERHLARCEECAQETASLREATALLGTAAAEPLPAGLKERVMAAVFGVSNGSMQQQLDQAQTSSQQIAAVLTAQDAVMMTGPVTGGGSATIVMSHARHALVFTAQGLRALPASRGYELWLIGPDGTRSAGMLPTGSHDMTGPVVASGLRQGDHLALTDEPAGGSARPTASMMLDVDL